MSYLVNPYMVVGTPESTELWSVTGTGGEEALSSAIPMLGQIFETGHVLIGKTITRFDVNFAIQGSPTNNITAQILDNSNVEKLLLEPLVDASTLPTYTSASGYFETKSFTAQTPSGGCVLADGDRLVIGGSFDNSNRPVMQGNTSTESYTFAEYFADPTWVQRTYDYTMSVWGY